MKNNIDLTSNEMFSRIPIKELSHWKLIGQKYPWEYYEMTEIKSEEDFKPKFESIFTGDKRERQRKQFAFKMESGDYCDCCGSYLKIIPWDKMDNICLCKTCKKEMSKITNKVPWIKDTNMKANRNLIEWLW